VQEAMDNAYRYLPLARSDNLSAVKAGSKSVSSIL